MISLLAHHAHGCGSDGLLINVRAWLTGRLLFAAYRLISLQTYLICEPTHRYHYIKSKSYTPGMRLIYSWRPWHNSTHTTTMGAPSSSFSHLNVSTLEQLG